MNEAQTETLRAVSAEIAGGEAPVDAVPWKLHEHHGIQQLDLLLQQSLDVIREILASGEVAITELKNGRFVPWPERRGDAVERLIATRTHDDPGPGVPSFGWSKPPQLFFLHRRFIGAPPN